MIFEKKKVTEHNICFEFLYKFCLKHFSPRRIWRDLIRNISWSSCKAPVILFQILMKPEFYRQFFEKYSNTKFTKIRPVGVEFLHAERWTDMTNLVVAFRNSANAPKNKPCFVSTIYIPVIFYMPYCTGRVNSRFVDCIKREPVQSKELVDCIKREPVQSKAFVL
jgi:hypothetical protein